MLAARERTIDSQGLAIHCLEWGEPGGEPLVLIHGFLDQAYSWTPFVAALRSEERRVGKECRL